MGSSRGEIVVLSDNDVDRSFSRIAGFSHTTRAAYRRTLYRIDPIYRLTKLKACREYRARKTVRA